MDGNKWNQNSWEVQDALAITSQVHPLPKNAD
jgi:hypothetical protein